MILDSGAVRQSYFVSGDGEPVTLLHGFTQSGQSWREVIAQVPAGRRFIVPDLRGHGATRVADGGPCSMETCASDVLALWDHLGVRRSHLVGYSMGGRLALHLAAHSPERLVSLLTLGAHAGLDEPQRSARRREDDALADRIERDGVTAFVDYWSGLSMFAGLARRGAPYVASIREQRLENEAAGLACSLRGMGAGAMEPVWDALARVGVPCTFVAGALDSRYVDYAQRLAAVTAGTTAWVAGAGHAAHLEAPEEFARILVRHLDAAAGSGASSSTRE